MKFRESPEVKDCALKVLKTACKFSEWLPLDIAVSGYTFASGNGHHWVSLFRGIAVDVRQW